MIKCLLWDFGNTLVDELSLWRAGPEWMEVYRSFGDTGGLGLRWCLGEISLEEMVGALARLMPLEEPAIRRHLENVDLFDYFPHTIAYFRERRLPQAIVTVNPAHFRHLATLSGLDQFVDEIVISGEEKTIDKADLCDLAIERMGGRYARSEALLIDNSRTNVDGWTARGGASYHYTTDEIFARDSVNGPMGLATAGVG